MAGRILLLVALPVVISFSACDGRKCDYEARTVCDSSTSGCISTKCQGKEGTDYVECFEVLCVPPLCECLENAGCAWQEPLCDDLVTD